MEISELNISEMNDLELKGILHSWLEKVKNRLQLEQIAEFMRPSIEVDIEEEAIFWSRYTPEQRIELEQAFEESLDATTGIEHEVMKQKHTKWLNV